MIEFVEKCFIQASLSQPAPVNVQVFGHFHTFNRRPLHQFSERRIKCFQNYTTMNFGFEFIRWPALYFIMWEFLLKIRLIVWLQQKWIYKKNTNKLMLYTLFSETEIALRLTMWSELCAAIYQFDQYYQCKKTFLYFDLSFCQQSNENNRQRSRNTFV